MSEQTLADIEPTGVSEKPSIKQYRCNSCGAEMLADTTPVCGTCMRKEINRMYKKYENLRDAVAESSAEIDLDNGEFKSTKPRTKTLDQAGEFQYSPKRDVLELRNELDETISEHNPRGDKSLYGAVKYLRTQFDRTLKDHPLTYHHKEE